MSDQTEKMSRPWREIAAEVQKEKDTKRLSQLVVELNAALDSQVIKPPPKQSATHC